MWTFEFPRMPWKDVVTLAADVAREGFNVTHDLGEPSMMECDAVALWWRCGAGSHPPAVAPPCS